MMRGDSDNSLGYALIELMITVAVMAIALPAIFNLSDAAHRERAWVEGYARDLDDLRRSLETIEVDLRSASSVRATDRGFDLVTAAGPVRIELCDAELVRVDEHGARRVLARCITDLRVEVDRRSVEVSLRLRQRAPASLRAFTVRTRVAMRGQEAR